jgi:hypothetical protein
VTEKRFFVSYYCWPLLDVELDDPRLRRIEVSSPAADALRIACGAGDLDPRRSGSMTIRVRTPRGSDVLSALPAA